MRILEPHTSLQSGLVWCGAFGRSVRTQRNQEIECYYQLPPGLAERSQSCVGFA
jgi:hypothetical protein